MMRPSNLDRVPGWERWFVGVTWPGNQRFTFADELALHVEGEVRCVGVAFPRRQPPLMKYFVVWPLFAWVTLRLFFLSIDQRSRIVCWQQAYGLGLGLIWRALEAIGVKPHATIDVLTFIATEPKRRGVARWLIAQALSARAVRVVLVFSQRELFNYRQVFPEVAEKFSFVVYTAADVPHATCVTDDEYYLAVGRSNRDHHFLVDAFRAFPQRRLIVLTDQHERSLSPNVEVMVGAFGNRYFQLLQRCRAVVLAFADPDISAGQLVYLQAVQYGKPVLTSRSACLEGYVKDGITGLVYEKDIASLDAALSVVEGERWYAEATAACAADYPARFGFPRLVQGYLLALARDVSRPL